MTVREVFNTVLPALGITQAEAVAKIGWTPQQMSQKNKRDSLRASEFFRIMEANGVEILFRIKGEEEFLNVLLSGHGHRIKGMADHVNYDTAAAGAISNSFYADGINEYDENGEAQELYIDQQGRYFIAEYNIKDPDRERVRAIPASVAVAFIEKYGTEIEKKPER